MNYHTSLSIIQQNIDKKCYAWDGFMKMTFVIIFFFIFVFSSLSQTCYQKILKTFNLQNHYIKDFEKKMF